MEPESDVQEVLETPEEPEVVEESTDDVELRNLDEELAELKAKAEKADELERKNRQLYERLKKKEEEANHSTNGLSTRDTLALIEAKITDEELSEVEEFARYKKLSIADALKSPTLKAILAERKEEARTARATEIKSPRGVAKNTGEDILRKAEKTGEVPEGIDELKAMLEARLHRKKTK